MEQPAATTTEPVNTSKSKNEESVVKKDREEWSEVAISTLIDAYTSKYGQLNGKGLRSKDWAEVVGAVNANPNSTKTVEHCRNKMDTLTKRYKAERKNKLSGLESTWPWYNKMEIIRGCSPSKGTGTGNAVNKLPLGPEKDKTSNRAKRGKRSSTLEELSAIASDQFAHQDDRSKLADGEKAVPLTSNNDDGTHGSSQKFRPVESPSLNARPAAPAGVDADEQHSSQENNYLARSIIDLASSLRIIGGSLTSSLNGFAEVYARVEISKMEIFRDLELKRMQMQLDNQAKVAAIFNRESAKRRRENSDSE